MEGNSADNTAEMRPNGLGQDAVGNGDKGSTSSPSGEKSQLANAAAQQSAKRKKMLRWSLLALLAVVIVVVAVVTPIEVKDHENSQSSSSRNGGSNSSKPNIVFILSDDQDAQMNSLDYMPVLQDLLMKEGTTYTRHYCTVALCCPSRVNLWTGRAAHNTNVTDLSPPYGGYPRFAELGLNSQWAPVWMQNAGYQTYYVGKLMNSHNTKNYDKPFPGGFNGTDFLLEPGTYSYLNPIFQRNQDAPVNFTNVYNTDLVTNKSLGFIDDAYNAGSPFFVTIAPIAPHADVQWNPDGSISTFPPIPKPEYNNSYPGVTVPRTPNFNPDQPSGVSWISRLKQQNDTNVAWNDEFFANRIRTLQSIDDLINQTVAKLDSYGVLDNTYIFYSSDNGYHIGQHRLQPGKSCAFETDVNVPLIVRGPNVPKNLTTEIVSSHTDLAPTFLTIAGAALQPDFDGLPIPLTQNDINSATTSESDEHVNIEYWGTAPTEGKYNRWTYKNNTYKALRLMGPNYSLFYSVWCNNEHELYDMVADPYQTNNLYRQNETTVMSKSVVDVKSRLDALLLVLKTCKGESCTAPWKQLHPDGSVKNLPQALGTQFNQFYTTQASVSFDKCDMGFIPEVEGPTQFIAFTHPELT